MNVFSSDQMLRTYAEVFFPGAQAEIDVYPLEGWDFRLLHVGGRRPLVSGPFMDFWEPVGASSPVLEGTHPEVRFLPRVSVASLVVEDAVPDFSEMSPAPSLRWSDVGDWEAFEALVRHRNGSVRADSRRQLRRLDREIGTLEFTTDEEGDEALDACILWKAARYRGAAAAFRNPRHREFLQRLRVDGLARVSSVRAGGRVLAAHVGLLHEGRFYYWMPAYDPEYRRYSPGRLLLEHLMEASCARGDAEFDFLVGNEPYKWNYATRVRLVGPLGRPPRGSVLVAKARRKLRLGRRLRRVRSALRL